MSLLLNEYPLLVFPSMAEKIGLNESIIIQQIHYWTERSEHVEDGHRWVYNSFNDWKKQFPFWSERTIKRTINNLEKEGYIISGNYNKRKFDRTKWYRINYEKLSEIGIYSHYSSVKMAHSIVPKWHDGECQVVTMDSDRMTRPIPETTTDNNTDIYNIAFEEIVDYLNEKVGSNYKHTTRKTRELIKARMNEGFTVDDFKTVIDKKAKEWLGTDMATYLRPQTLFGTKFESYLNQIDKTKLIPLKPKVDPNLVKLRRMMEEANARQKANAR